MAPLKSTLISSLLVGLVAGRDVPSNVRNFYNSIKSQGQCNNVLSGGFYSEDGDAGDSDYCGDHMSDYNVIYLQGKNGNFVNMDIDCDGIQDGPANDGRCGPSGDTQPQTSFQGEVAGYGKGQDDLDANAHPYVVFGNVGDRDGWKHFDPQQYGIEPLSIMAVVCGDQLIYGVWGDENGDDGDYPVVGEASISLATACFGTSINGNSGHDENDVLFIAFPGSDAVPGADGAAWNAQNYNDFEASITSLGDNLIQRIGGNGTSSPPPSGGGGGGNPPSGGGGGGSCDWEGHCQGASCGSDDDCSDSLTCVSGTCGGTACSWEGHCAGASCGSDDDCSDSLACSGGKCS